MSEILDADNESLFNITRIRSRDSYLEKFYIFIIKYGSMLFSLSIAFLVGRLSNGIANPEVRNFSDLYLDMFGLSNRPINWVNWVILAATIFLPLSKLGARIWRKNTSYDNVLIAILQRLKDKSLTRFNVIGADKALTLQKCPEMERGWKPYEIDFDHQNRRFRIPDDLTSMYKDFYKHYLQEHGEDRPTVTLVERPVAWTDRSNRLELKTQENLYSYSQFYWQRVVPDSDRYVVLINNLYQDGIISFPHNLCLHLVVMTKDEKILLTLRSKKVGSDKGTWSCSIEENLQPDDIRSGDRKSVVTRWMRRAIFEELGVNDQYYTEENLRILSVFLEANRMNISLVGLVHLDMSFNELSRMIDSLPRNDYEFTDFEGMSIKEMAQQLVRPTRNYHPTSRYRMLMTLLHRYGEQNFARMFVSLIDKNR